MIKVLSIFGTRPEAIKMAPVIKELEKRDNVKSIVCVTAQHRQMLDQVLRAFKITRSYDLNVMTKNQTINDILTKSLGLLNDVIRQVQPDIVLVHGDTTTTLAGALAAFHNKVDIGHVEAGLRTYDKYSPYPEEINRQMVDCMTDLYFAPTEQSKQNLLSEKVAEEKIIVTGNTAIDALATTISDNYHHKDLDWVKEGERLILLTTHRKENIGEPMERIFRAVKRIVNDFPDVKVIYPVHLNPQVREIALRELSGIDRIRLIEPLDVVDFHNFMNKCYMVMTDSGGLQEEAPALDKPVLVLRDTTERPEGIKAGTLKLAGTDEDSIYTYAYQLLSFKAAYEKMSKATNPYGDGHAAQRIVDAIVERYQSKNKDDSVLTLKRIKKDEK